ncbi:DUF4233 domain-containing protein [Tomitella biformata]|uniref:DUF4233 domain-containing protein n=1 Tax=Tomitella biformata TaxID=630403 RepID=UPI0004634A58|nr:DUF4233 domain-containing protein [Tomitella biformata]
MSEELTVAEEFNPPLKDPWKMFRGVMAGTLVLQAIIVMLALPVVSYLSEDLKSAKLTYVAVLGLLMFVGAGFQGRSWAIPYNIALQVLAVAAWWVHPALGVCGLVFAALWGYLLYLRSDMKEREAHGLLPGQRDFGQDG